MLYIFLFMCDLCLYRMLRYWDMKTLRSTMHNNIVLCRVCIAAFVLTLQLFTLILKYWIRCCSAILFSLGVCGSDLLVMVIFTPFFYFLFDILYLVILFLKICFDYVVITDCAFYIIFMLISLKPSFVIF